MPEGYISPLLLGLQGGKTAEVLAFLVMCFIYSLALGLGSLNPVEQVDFSDHVSSVSHMEVRCLES